MGKTYNFFIDIDGTLIPRGKNEISKKVLDSLAFAREKGCKIFINTARSYANIPNYLKELPFLDATTMIAAA